MLKYQLYQTPRLIKRESRLFNSGGEQQSSGQDINQPSQRQPGLLNQIGRHPALALNVGVLSGILIGWWVKR